MPVLRFPPSAGFAFPVGPAGGDLGGTFPNPTIVDLSIAGSSLGDIARRGVANWETLDVGAEGEVLTAISGQPEWAPSTTQLQLTARNETGSAIPDRTLVSFVGESGGFRLIDVADKDVGTVRPAGGITVGAIADGANGIVHIFGPLSYDTTTIAIDLSDAPLEVNDQLVLGDDGAISRPPPDKEDFDGEIQPVGHVVFLGSPGEILFNFGGLSVETAAQAFALDSNLPVGRFVGGDISRGGGLDVNVAAGQGYVIDGGTFRRVRWNADVVTLPASTMSSIIVDVDGIVQSTPGFEPNLTATVQLAVATTNATDVVFLVSNHIQANEINERQHEFLRDVVGPLSAEGGTVTVNGLNGLRFDVDAAVFYDPEVRKAIGSVIAPTFTTWYQDGLGGWTQILGQTDVDPSLYDDGSGALASVPLLQWTKPLLYVSAFGSIGEFHVVVGQETFASQVLAENGAVPMSPEELQSHSLRLAGLIVQQGSIAISEITDERPRLGQLAASASTGTTSPSPHAMAGIHHGPDTLANLNSKISDADVPPDTRAINSGTGLTGGGNLTADRTLSVLYGTSVGTSTQGNDARVPTQSENDALVGTDGAPSAANPYVTDSDPRNSDDRVPTGAAGGGLNGTYPNPEVDGMTAGSLTNDAAHGLRGGGTQHADVVASGASGFMTGVDKTKLDTVTAGAAVASVTAGAGLVNSGTATNPIVDVVANADGSIVANANDVGVGVLATDAQHGARGGGTQHSVATTSVAGFHSAADKLKIDGIETGAINAQAGSGLTRTGSTLNVGAGSGITVNADDVAVSFGLVASVTTVNAGDAASAGVSNTSSRADHEHAVSTAAPSATGVGTASAEGAATSLARSDHSHQSNTAPANVTKAAAAIGTSGEPARADHKHDVTTAAAVGLGSANAEGSSTSLSRADHVHARDVARQESVTTQAITGTDTALTDTLDGAPNTNASVRLFLNGVLLKQGATFDYTISGSTITWLASTGTAPDLETNDELIAVYASAS